MEYFTLHPYCEEDIRNIASEEYNEWHSLAGLIKTMLWLDVKRYVEQNLTVINNLIEKHGVGWISFLPSDISGFINPNKIIIESIVSSLSNENLNIDKEGLLQAVDSVKTSLSSLQIDYQSTDIFISLCKIPKATPYDDNEWSLFGYSIFWCAMRKRKIDTSFCFNALTDRLQSGDIQLMANALRGIKEQCNSSAFCTNAVSQLMQRIEKEYCFIYFFETETEVQCKFVPPVFTDKLEDSQNKNFNHYWRNKLLNILQQIYSDKEYIEIEVIGTNILFELGIKVIDDKVRIKKENRYLAWITEINSWLKSRIDYLYRPESWYKYVQVIDSTTIK